MNAPRIALIHATPVAVEPIRAAFALGWPQARITNLLEDSLSQDLADEGTLTDRMIERFVTLARYAVDCRADAILFTCSAFGRAIEAARDAVAVPVLKPNEAMFEQALDVGTRFGLVSTFGPSIASMVAELESLAASRGRAVSVRTATVAGAMDDLQHGRADRHDKLVADACSGFADVDVLMLAQFSMARAVPSIAPVVGRRVLTSPDSAVARLKRALTEGARSQRSG